MSVEQTATLVVGGWTSKCGACGRSADPEEATHQTRPGGYSGRGSRPGCGARFTAVATEYTGQGPANATKAMRPDLPFIGEAS